MLTLSTAALALTLAVADPCDDLRALIDEVYDFQPSALTAAEKDAAGAEMNRVWELVESAPDELAPCLRAALESDDADPWFRFDGSALLVRVDPSFESKALQAALWSEVSFEEVDLRYWLESLTRLGLEGHDVSVAAERWLLAGRQYYVPEHGLYQVEATSGAIMLFGSMTEAQAAPALARIADDREHEGRLFAINLLTMQGTRESWRALDALHLEGVPDEAVAVVRRVRSDGPRRAGIEPGETATRAELLAGLQAVVDGESSDLYAGLSASDWTLNAIQQLGADDLGPLRQLRRRRATSSSDEAGGDFMRLSLVITSLSWSPEHYDD